ncbi:hypothetical protein [Microbacterium sp.]|uniref:hypothetical protein n=1 Tax=Microbacterium sp. TaxID=51671 RepID=UPI00281110F2|nr:hypothetical protein [Microbacterium sp.]
MARASLARYRFWFVVDAVVTGVNAVVYLSLHRVLPDVLGSSAQLYIVAGIVLGIVTVGLVIVGASSQRLRGLPELLVAVNVTWAGGSLFVALADPFGLTGWGTTWAVVQALVVSALAIVQARALRRSGTVGAGVPA